MYDPTYTYDWPQAIDDLENRCYDAEQCEEIMDAAEDWVTCACGNLCKDIPRDEDGAPIDKKLWNLGCDFSVAICNLASDGVRNKSIEAARARQILQDIETRAAELLNERK